MGIPCAQVNSFGSGAQAIVVFLLLPGLAALRGINPGQLPQVGVQPDEGLEYTSCIPLCVSHVCPNV